MSEEPSVDFLKKKYGLVPDRHVARRSKWVGRLVLAGLGFGALTALAFSWQLSKSIDNSIPETGHFSILSTVRRLVGSEDKPLTGETDDRVNFLLLGVGGDGLVIVVAGDVQHGATPEEHRPDLHLAKAALRACA